MKRIFAVACLLLFASSARADFSGTPPLIVGLGGTGQLSLTSHYVLVGAGTAGLTMVAPSATAGVPLVSGGASADPSYTTAVVAGGGTGVVTLAANGVLVGEGTSAVHVVGTSSSADAVLAWGAAGADPTALSVNNCATALTYSTSTHTFGCNATVSPTLTTYTTSNATVTLAATNLLTTVFSQTGTPVATINLPTISGLAAAGPICIKDGTNGFASHVPTVKTTDSSTIDGTAGATGVTLPATGQKACFQNDGATAWYRG